MAKQSTITDQVRRAIEQSGLSRYEISRISGVDQGILSRFMRGRTGLSTTSLDKLGPVLRLRIVVDPPSK